MLTYDLKLLVLTTDNHTALQVKTYTKQINLAAIICTPLT